MRRKIEIEARKGSLDRLLDILCRDLERVRCPADMMTRICLCAEEIFVNICSYAYPHREGNVTVEEETGRNRVRLIFCDMGVPYDPLSEKPPDITLPAEERTVGGLGIFLVRNMAGQAAYERREGMNRFSVRFSWNEAAPLKESAENGQEEKTDGHQRQI